MFKAVGDRLYEAISFNNKSTFLCYDNNDKKFTLEPEIEIAGEKLLPIEESNSPVNLPLLDNETWKELQAGDVPTVDDVWDMIYAQLEAYTDLEVEYKAVITATIMESYQQHKNYSTGYMLVTGDFGSGKSVVIILASKLSYRAMNCSGANAANVYRYIGYDKENEAQKTICEDENDYTKLTPELEDKFKIYRVGYKRGNTVPRIDDAGTSNSIQRFYRTFCVKFFAGVTKSKDHAFNSRCVEIKMVMGDPEIDEFTVEDDAKFAKINLKCIAWRMKTYFDPLPDIATELKGRMKEIWKPKIVAVHGAKVIVPVDGLGENDEPFTPETLMTYLALKDVKTKFDEKQSRLEVYVMRTVYELSNELDWHGILFKLIWMRLMKNLGVSDPDVTDASVRSIDVPLLGVEVSKKQVSRTLNFILRGKNTTARDKTTNVTETFWTFERKTIERIARGYNLEPKKEGS